MRETFLHCFVVVLRCIEHSSFPGSLHSESRENLDSV